MPAPDAVPAPGAPLDEALAPWLARRLPRAFFDRETALVAEALLGCCVVRVLGGQLRVGRIVETEAYLGPQDLAAHSRHGRTPRNAALFGPPGHAYVYFVYGMHWCLNAVTMPEGHGSGVLLRALEPVLGLAGRTQGPALLAKALGVTGALGGTDLCEGRELFIARPAVASPDFRVDRRPRVGVAYAGDWAARPLRFSIHGNACVSPAS